MMAHHPSVKGTSFQWLKRLGPRRLKGGTPSSFLAPLFSPDFKKHKGSVSTYQKTKDAHIDRSDKRVEDTIER
jgi:hypothetical protein